MSDVSPDPVFDRYAIPATLRPWSPPVARRMPRVPVLHIGLFAATFVTTAMAGAFQVGADPLQNFASIRAGFPFAITLMSILLAHEMGHYTVAQIHGVRATLPYFIPAPPLFVGTFGAFIRMKSLPPNRTALFDVGAAGPWAGLLLSIPAVLIGLHWSEVRPAVVSGGGLVLGDSFLFTWLTKLALGTTPDDATILLHPIALAGWFGLFVTFLNLLPMGQLDGGHVAYALFGRGHRWIARSFLGVILVLGFQGWPGWFVWVALVWLLGTEHPPTSDPVTPLDWRRRVAAWLTVGVFVITFMPAPLMLSEPARKFEGDTLAVSVRLHPPPTRRGGLVVPTGLRPRPQGLAL